MARTKTEFEEEVAVVTADDATIEQETAEQPVETEAKVSVSKKKVKIRIVEDVDCLIACTPYKFTKDKEVAVPSDVAAILCFAKKAYRL